MLLALPQSDMQQRGYRREDYAPDYQLRTTNNQVTIALARRKSSVSKGSDTSKKTKIIVNFSDNEDA